MVAAVPARDEAEVVGRSVHSLLDQQYDPTLHVVLVDDASRDATAAVARHAAGRDADRLTVVAGAPLAPGWTGKLWAVSQGIAEARRLKPDFLLLTDADVVHDQANLARLVAVAERGAFDLASLMVKLHCESLAEKSLIPALVLFFFLLYPPAWIDDCALAARIKGTSGALWLGVTPDTRSIRAYGGFAPIGAMIARTAYTQLEYSPPRLVGTLAGMLIAYAAPPCLALSGNLFAAAAWLLMTAAYLPVLRFYGRRWICAPALPLAALFYTAATVWSAIQHGRGRAGAWKGRIYPVGRQSN